MLPLKPVEELNQLVDRRIAEDAAFHQPARQLLGEMAELRQLGGRPVRQTHRRLEPLAPATFLFMSGVQAEILRWFDGREPTLPNAPRETG
jgi:hypothetical protein